MCRALDFPSSLNSYNFDTILFVFAAITSTLSRWVQRFSTTPMVARSNSVNCVVEIARRTNLPPFGKTPEPYV